MRHMRRWRPLTSMRGGNTHGEMKLGPTNPPLTCQLAIPAKRGLTCCIRFKPCSHRSVHLIQPATEPEFCFSPGWESANLSRLFSDFHKACITPKTGAHLILAT